METMLLFILIQLSFFQVWSYGNFSFAELSALQDIYDATDGPNWSWRSDYSVAGNIWNFTNYPNINPCEDYWQGVFCDNSCSNTSYACSLVKLRLTNYNLVGTLPSSIVNLNNATFLRFDNNLLSGSLPSSLGSMLLLTSLNVAENHFDGTIPTELSAISHLELLYLQDNSLTGSIPSELSQLSWARRLYLSGNCISSTIPTAFGQLSALSILNLQRMSNLHGPIPSQLGNMGNMVALLLNDNYLSGTLPSLLTRLSKLEVLSLTQNQLIGPLFCSNIKNLTHLRLVNFGRNMLTGTLCSEIGFMTHVEVLYAEQNFFEGPIMSTIGYMTNLITIVLYRNSLTGTIPSSIYKLQQLADFEADKNSLTGTLSPNFGNISGLTIVYLQSNSLSGVIPSTFASLTDLNTLILGINFLTGFDGESFSGSTNQNLSVIDISNNNFRGTIPTFLFTLPEIAVMVATANCFAGSIPSSICDATTLVSLNLDGLTSGDQCLERVLPYSKSYTSRFIDSSIPNCIFQLPNLVTLQLSGNGLTGSLPSDFPADTKLRNISLSHNRLTGQIPMTLKELPTLEMLDLSFNRIKGDLYEMDNYTLETNPEDPSFVPTELILWVNRLSGRLPSSFKDASIIHILDGNLFDCVHNSELPQNDENVETYVCGSHMIRNAFGSFAACFVAFVAFIVILTAFTLKNNENCSKGQNHSFWKEYYEVSIELYIYLSMKFSSPYSLYAEGRQRTEILKLFKLFRQLRVLSKYISLVAFVVFVPVYVVLSFFYSTHEYEYGWVVSIAMVTGLVPGIVMAILWTLLIYACGYAFQQFHLEMVNFRKSLESMVSLAAVRAVAEPEISNEGQSSQTSFETVETEFSAFTTLPSASWHRYPFSNRQLFYLNVVAPLVNVFCVLLLNGGYVYVVLTQSYVVVGLVQLVYVVFKIAWNARMVPCLVTWAFSPQMLGREPTSIESQSFPKLPHRQSRLIIFNNVLAPILATLFTDSNCFSTLFAPMPSISSSYYYPVCDFSPLAGCKETVESLYPITSEFAPPFIYNFQCSSALIVNFAPVLVFMYTILGIFLPSFVAISIYSMVDLESKEKEKRFANMLGSRRYGLFRPTNMTCSFMGHFAVLVTFGIAYPPIAGLILFYFLVTTVMWQALVGKLFELKLTPRVKYVCDVLEHDCKDLSQLLWESSEMIICIFFIFSCFFMMDILGDGVHDLALTTWLPLLFFGLFVGGYFVYYCRVFRQDLVESRMEKLAARRVSEISTHDSGRDGANGKMDKYTAEISLHSVPSDVVSALHSAPPLSYSEPCSVGSLDRSRQESRRSSFIEMEPIVPP